MFQAFVALVAVGSECRSFQEAFRHFYVGIKEMLVDGTSAHVLETACFIRYVFIDREETFTVAMGFYDCCDLAHQIGLLSSEGNLVSDDVKELPTEDIQQIFLRSGMAGIFDILNTANEISKNVSTR